MFKNNSIFGWAVLLSSALAGIVPGAYAQQVQDIEAIHSTDKLIQDFLPQSRPGQLTPRGIGVGTASRETESEVVVILRKVQFVSDSSRLTLEAKEQLRQLVGAWNSDRLKFHRYKIEGHTDSRGNAEHNMILSEQRAEAVKNFLVKEGVDSARLIAIGKGEEEPLYPENPESGKNRAVVFKPQ